MFRALSLRRNRQGYEQLDGEGASTSALVPKLSRAESLPVDILKSPKNKTTKEAKVAKKASKVHPFFSLFETKKRKKPATRNPEFSRYLEYVREGGAWDMAANRPVMYYK